MSPCWIGIAHFCPGGQHFCVFPVTQHERLFGQQPALPQQRVVALLQHFFSHSSSFGAHRLQRPVAGFAQRQFVGQHLLGPQRARPLGQRGSQTRSEPVPIRMVRHSSFGLQQRGPQPVSCVLQQSCWSGFAQNSPGLQHFPLQGMSQTSTQTSPGWPLPHRVPFGQQFFSQGGPPPPPLRDQVQQTSSGLQQSR
jgi:hypothetical protein